MRDLVKVACAVVAVAGLGCGGSGLRTLTAGDVGPIAPGTAVGALYSGSYTVTSGTVLGCRCRVGSCGTIHVIVGDTLGVVESDGALQISFASTGDACSGGIDADGTFSCGGTSPNATGTSYGLFDGQFHSSGTVPTFVGYTAEATLTTPTLDCDLRANETAQFVSAFAPTASSPPSPPAGWGLAGGT
jgi:hypothetical protein